MPDPVIKPLDVTVSPTPSQVVRLEPVVAAVLGGGTSAVLIRGDESLAGGGVRVTLDGPQTSALTGTSCWAVN
jgi:hypothetical protein